MIKRAKVSFFQEKIDKASTAEDNFEITKWHKTKGIFTTLPVVDTLSPRVLPAQTHEEKSAVLVKKLLFKQNGTDDLPLSTTITATTSLPLSQNHNV